MPKIAYIERKFTKGRLEIIDMANDILDTYDLQGYSLTLRQLYYQFIAKDLFPESWRDKKLNTKNTQRNYKRFGDIINDGRLAGHIDWKHIDDRTRNLKRLGHWDDPADIIRSAAHGFHLDWWADQDYYAEVWIEKEALMGVIEGTCEEYDLPHFACRGYSSQSEMWRASMRMHDVWENSGRNIVILQMSDHDPSGVDIERDIIDRFGIFGPTIEVKRLALTFDQVEDLNPPPSPAKITDSRADGYISQYGNDSWEMDALEPGYLNNLIIDAVTELIDEDRWEKVKEREEDNKETLRRIARHWDRVAGFVDNIPED